MGEQDLKFCKHCGEKILKDAVICTKCGRQVEDLKKGSNENIVINNNNSAVASATVSGGYSSGRCVDKWISLLLCIFLGILGAHKFYEGKTGMGILYLLTGGLCGIGWVIDIIIIALKPNPYYV